MAGRNMEITVAKTAGFCFGVKRAVEKVYDQIATGKKPIYTYGPIIHNEEVVRDLEERTGHQFEGGTGSPERRRGRHPFPRRRQGDL